MIKATIFDLDGTLVDTFEANAQAYILAFKEQGIEFTKEEYHQYFGSKWSSWGKKYAKEKEEIVHNRKIQLYQTLIREVKPIKSTISKYTELKNQIPLILMTDASKDCAQLILKEFNLTFDKEFYGIDYGSTEDMLKDIIQYLDLSAKDILLIDDSLHRIEKAKELGLKTQHISK